MNDIIFAIAGRKESYLVSKELIRQKRLCEYITTVYYRRMSWTRILSTMFLRRNGVLRKKIGERRSQELDPFVKQKCEILGLFELFLTQKEILPRLLDFLRDYLACRINIFALKEAKRKQKKFILVYYTRLNDKVFAYRDKYCPDVKIIVYVTGTLPAFFKEICCNDSMVTKDNYAECFCQEECEQHKIQRSKVITENADGFIAISQIVKRSLLYNGVPENKIRIVTFGADTEAFKEKKEYSLNNKKVEFLYVGRVEATKGIQHLLPAFSRLPKDKCSLRIIGKYSNDDPYYQKYCKNSNICFTGPVSHEEVGKMMAKADVFILPSISDGFGLVGLEAMLSGMPVIASSNAGASDIVKDGENGFVFESSNRSELESKMQYFIDNREKIEEMGKKAASLAQSMNFFVNICEIIDELI